MKSISFLVNPDASFIPPHELQAADRRLAGFAWLEEMRPSMQDIMVRCASVLSTKQATPAKGKKAPAKTRKAPAKAAAQTPARK